MRAALDSQNDEGKLKSQRDELMRAGTTLGLFVLSFVALAVPVFWPAAKPHPGTFGPILQPVIWLAAVAISIRGLLASLVAFCISSTGRIVAMYLGFFFLCLACCELLFVMFGPDI